MELPEVAVDPALLGLQLEVGWNCSFSPEVPSPHRAELAALLCSLLEPSPTGSIKKGAK